MKAIICTKYGSPEVLELQEITKPLPKDNEVLIKIYATTVTAWDARVRAANFGEGWSVLGRLAMGFEAPRKSILGGELSGEIESIGKDVKLFKPGDQVLAFSGASFGANAEYICLCEESMIVLKPVNLTHEEAASIPFGALTALVFIRDRANIRKDQKVLVYGASWAVGSAAVQLSKYYGAEVTAVCSLSNIDLVKTLGADKVIDYTQEDFRENGELYDVIIETVGKIPFADCKASLKENGQCVLVSGWVPDLLRMLWSMIVGGKKLITWVVLPDKKDLVFIKHLIETGEIKPVIDKTYSLEQTAEAHHYVDTGRKKGSVVIKVV